MDTKKEFLKLKKKLATEELHANVKKSLKRIVNKVNEAAPKAFGNTGQIQVTVGNPLTNTIVFTGAGPETRQRLIVRARRMGYAVVDKVERTTAYLVVADLNTNSVKARAARRFGVRMVTYSQFFG